MFRAMNNIACQIDLRASLLYHVILIVYVENTESDARFFSKHVAFLCIRLDFIISTS